MNNKYICKVYFTYSVLYISHCDDNDNQPTQGAKRATEK